MTTKYTLPVFNGSSYEFVEIDSIEVEEHEGPVYDIELEKNHYFSANSIVSHNCRLRSDMSELNELNTNLIGGGSTKIGSLGVVTVNFPRLAWQSENEEDFFDNLRESVDTVAKINNSKRHIIRKRIDKGALPLYSLGYMDLRQQFMTYGVNGLNECLDILGYDILTEEGKNFALKIINVINEENNKQQKKYKAPFNCEQTPSENSAIKMAKKDKLLKYNDDEYSIYSNQFIPLTTEANLLDRVYLQGVFDKHFSGGSIMHANVEQQLETTQQMVDLIDLCTENGVIYWAVNYNLQECENGHISVAKGETCPTCGGIITYNYTRVVGFLTKVASWAKERREEDYPNREFYTV